MLCISVTCSAQCNTVDRAVSHKQVYRPSTDKYHYFVKNNKNLKIMWHMTCKTWHVTCDMWHVTWNTWHLTRGIWHKSCDMWHMTYDTWHMTHDMWHMTCGMLWGVNILSKFQLPSSYCLWFMIFWRFGGKGWLTDWLTDWLTEWMNNKAVYVEQLRIHQVC